MRYKKPSLFFYRLTQAVSWIVATFIFKRKVLRNEIKEQKEPFVLIANHQAKLDFVNIIGLRKKPMSFVISNSFYNALPIKSILNKIGVIPKQQFQTSASDLKNIKAVIDAGESVVIYPAGLMCEDGLSTPIPSATYKFLKWLNVDVYIARTYGSYFVMPKWARGMRSGRTYIDVYKLFSKEELNDTDLDSIKQITDDALLFDAYREQERFLVKYKNNKNICGLENVLYQCPHCKTEFSTIIREDSIIECCECGFFEQSDEYGFLHNLSGIGEEVRYISDWSRMIFSNLEEEIENGTEKYICVSTEIYMIENNKFVKAGSGEVGLDNEKITLNGLIYGEETKVSVSVANLPTLPFSPGKYFELQNGKTIYRCVLNDGKLVMKLVNMLKIFHQNRVKEKQMA